MASQYTLIVTTKLATKASQLKSDINLGAAKSNTTVKTILTNSQANKPNIASFGWATCICRLKALTNTMAGITTATTPQATDAANLRSSVNSHVSKTIEPPKPACKATMRQGINAGFFSRQACASSAVRGLNSGSSTPSTSLDFTWSGTVWEFEAISVISMCTPVASASNVAKTRILYVKTRAFHFFGSDARKLQGLRAFSGAFTNFCVAHFEDRTTSRVSVCTNGLNFCT